MIAKRRPVTKVLLALATMLGLAAVVLAVEVALAINAPRLPATKPYELSRSTSGSSVRKVLWLGDSTAAGVGATSPDAALPRLVDKELHPEGGTELVVRAVSGATVAEVVDEQIPEIAGERFDRIFVSAGANDVTGLTGKSSFRDDYQRLLNALPPADEVVLLGIPDMGSSPRFPQPLRAISGIRGEQLDSVIESLAEHRDHTYVDIQSETGTRFREHSIKNFAADEYHPSNDGYQLWADAVVEAIRR